MLESVTVSVPDLVKDEELPTLPTRSRSGRAINPRVIRTMVEQHEAAKAAYAALDALERVIATGKRLPPRPRPR
jgi:hypothetical protein